jgi:hypothetical protein
MLFYDNSAHWRNGCLLRWVEKNRKALAKEGPSVSGTYRNIG